MDEKGTTVEQAIESPANQTTKTKQRAGTALRKKALSDLNLAEALERLVDAEKTIEKQKRKIRELVNVVLRRPDSYVRK